MTTTSDIQFVLTGKMTEKIKQINNIKKEIILLKSQMNMYKNTIHYQELKNSIHILEVKSDKIRKEFISEFRKENKKEIKAYLDLEKNV